MGAVRGPEGVVHVELAEGGEPVGEGGVVLLLAGLEAEVLEQEHLPLAEVAGRPLRLVPDDVVDEADVTAEMPGEDGDDRRERVPVVPPALGAAEVGTGDDLGAVLDEPPERGHRGAHPQVVGDVAVVVQGDVEVVADQDPPAADVGPVDGAELHYESLPPTSRARSTSRLEYPHSLSYQPRTFTRLPLAIVDRLSKMVEWGSPTMSEETIGSSV